MPDEIPITVYGDVDQRAVDQLRRCAQAGDAVAGALCADGHVGYSQPIGGVVAYPDHISPSGVGYDIACLVAGTPVTSIDGWWKPIERVEAGAAIAGWDTQAVRRIEPCDGAVARGVRPIRRIVLATGRALGGCSPTAPGTGTSTPTAAAWRGTRTPPRTPLLSRTMSGRSASR